MKTPLAIISILIYPTLSPFFHLHKNKTPTGFPVGVLFSRKL